MTLPKKSSMGVDLYGEFVKNQFKKMIIEEMIKRGDIVLVKDEKGEEHLAIRDITKDDQS